MIVFLLGAAVGRAEEKPAPARPATAAAAEDSISSAKRDFDLIKSARDPALQPGGGMPRVSMPELHAGAPDAAPRLPSTKGEAKPKSENWLVEAMEKPRDAAKAGKEARDGRAIRGQGETSEEIDAVANGVAPGREETRPATGATTPEKPAERKPGDPAVFNPLAQFLGEWMTPKDYALLGTSLQKPGGPGDLNGSTTGVGAVAEMAGVSPVSIAASSSGPGRSVLPATPRENPFLEALNLPAPASTTAAASGTVASSPAPVFSVAPPPPPVAPTKPKVPEFVKPQADEKYFKPLKRF